MRTSQKLRRVAVTATALVDLRGDTLWSDAEREAVATALRLLDDLTVAPR